MKPDTDKAPARKKPSWWSPKAGIWLMLGFGVVAAWPYLTTTTKLVAAGEAVSMDKVMDSAMKEKERYDEPEKMREIKACLTLSDGTMLVGTKAGMFVKRNGTWSYDEGFRGGDVKMMTASPDGTAWAATKNGVFGQKKGETTWQKVYDQEVHSVSFTADNRLVVTSKKAIYEQGADGKWTTLLDKVPDEAIPAAMLEKMANMRKEKERDHEHGHDHEHGDRKRDMENKDKDKEGYNKEQKAQTQASSNNEEKYKNG